MSLVIVLHQLLLSLSVKTEKCAYVPTTKHFICNKILEVNSFF